MHEQTTMKSAHKLLRIKHKGKKSKSKRHKHKRRAESTITTPEEDCVLFEKQVDFGSSEVPADTTASIPQTKKGSNKVTFSETVEVFPSSEKEEERDHGWKTGSDGVVHGKWYSKQEDEMLKEAILNYIKEHDLGENGLDMVMNCKKYHKIKTVWKEIKDTVMPWRPALSLRDRGHLLFERSNDHIYTSLDEEIMEGFYKDHGPNWAVLAKSIGKYRKHLKDHFRKIKARKRATGKWSQSEYQQLFDLVNVDLQMKCKQVKDSKHGMLRDNIPWSAISDRLQTRSEYQCFRKWYEQLSSPMVAKREWRDSDDYKMIKALSELDASNVEDVDWDEILENRSGEVCSKRWKQMVCHLGDDRYSSFVDQVDVLSKRYCPELYKERLDFENRPYDK